MKKRSLVAVIILVVAIAAYANYYTNGLRNTNQSTETLAEGVVREFFIGMDAYDYDAVLSLIDSSSDFYQTMKYEKELYDRDSSGKIWRRIRIKEIKETGKNDDGSTDVFVKWSGYTGVGKKKYETYFTLTEGTEGWKIIESTLYV